MNVAEGLKRIATAIRWLGLAWLVTVSLAVYYAMEPSSWWQRSVAGLVFAGLPMVLAYLVAWIIEGFAKSRQSG